MRVQSLLLVGIRELPDCFNRVMQDHKCAFTAVPDAQAALRALSGGRTFDVMIIRANAACNDEVLRKLEAAASQTFILALHDAALEEGPPDVLASVVSGYLSSPITEVKLKTMLGSAGRFLTLAQENQYCRTREIKPDDEFVGRAESVRQVFRVVDSVAALDTPLFLSGPPGTGKNLLARIIHRRSSRKQGPFIRVNCCDHPESLLEAELFDSGTARFELADKGTLVLDHLEHVNEAVQQRVLSVLKEAAGEKTAIAGGTPALPNVRLICIANCEAGRSAKEGLSNAELCRLLTPIRLPLLGERGEDAILLAEFFMRCFSRTLMRPEMSLALTAREALLAYRWPGNVQELKHCIERAVLLADHGEITAEMLGLPQAQGVDVPGKAVAAEGEPAVRNRNGAATDAGVTLPDKDEAELLSTPAGPVRAADASDPGVVTIRVGQPLVEVEREMIQRTLEQAHGNRTKAAGVLGISVRTLYTKLLEIEQLKEHNGT